MVVVVEMRWEVCVEISSHGFVYDAWFRKGMNRGAIVTSYASIFELCRDAVPSAAVRDMGWSVARHSSAHAPSHLLLCLFIVVLPLARLACHHAAPGTQ